MNLKKFQNNSVVMFMYRINWSCVPKHGYIMYMLWLRHGVAVRSKPGNENYTISTVHSALLPRSDVDKDETW